MSKNLLIITGTPSAFRRLARAGRMQARMAKGYSGKAPEWSDPRPPDPKPEKISIPKSPSISKVHIQPPPKPAPVSVPPAQQPAQVQPAPTPTPAQCSPDMLFKLRQLFQDCQMSSVPLPGLDIRKLLSGNLTPEEADRYYEVMRDARYGKPPSED